MIPPKEKAGELVEKFFKINDNELSKKGCNPFIDRDYAKKCALIAVDEVISTLNKDIRDLDVNGSILLNLIKYWREVRQEIIDYDKRTV